MTYKINDPAEMPVQDTAGVIHPASMIAGEIEAEGYTVEEAAERIGVADHVLRQIVQGEAPVTPDVADRLGILFGGEFSEVVLRWQRTYDQKR